MDEILNLIESVSEGFPTYSYRNSSTKCDGRSEVRMNYMPLPTSWQGHKNHQPHQSF